MQGPVDDALLMRRIDGATDLPDEGHGRLDRRRSVVSHRDVEGLSGHVLLSHVGHAVFEPDVDRRDDARVRDVCLNHPGQRVNERLRLFWGDVEMKRLDRDEAVFRRLVCAEYGAGERRPPI